MASFQRPFGGENKGRNKANFALITFAQYCALKDLLLKMTLLGAQRNDYIA